MLLQEQYDFGVDIWSLGCVLGELMLTSEEYLDEFKEFPEDKKRRAVKAQVKKRHLFKGDSCFPLSPQRASKNHDTQSKGLSENDQLLLVNQMNTYE